jgi:hypothetical protein
VRKDETKKKGETTTTTTTTTEMLLDERKRALKMLPPRTHFKKKSNTHTHTHTRKRMCVRYDLAQQDRIELTNSGLSTARLSHEKNRFLMLNAAPHKGKQTLQGLREHHVF